MYFGSVPLIGEQSQVIQKCFELLPGKVVISLSEEDIDLMFSIIKENACRFKETSISKFFVYSIASESIDHNFLIIQFQDEEFNIRYKLLQSWMLRYELEDYMKNRSNTLSSAEFDKFCEGLESVQKPLRCF